MVMIRVKSDVETENWTVGEYMDQHLRTLDQNLKISSLVNSGCVVAEYIS